MAYKQNGINILGTGLGGKETDTNRGKGLGGDELQRKFGEKIEVPKVPKVTPTKRNNQTSIDGTANYQADLKNSMDAMPVRGLKGETANTSKPDGFEKARNRGGSLPAGNSFTDLGIATAKNILSGAKEGINKFKEKRAAKIAADPKRAKIKDLKSQLKEKRKSGRAENKSGRQDKRIAKLEGKLGGTLTPEAMQKKATTGREQLKDNRAKPGISTAGMKTKLKTIGERKKPVSKVGSVSTTQSNQPTPSIKTQAINGSNSVVAGTSSTAVGSVGGPGTTENNISNILGFDPANIGSMVKNRITPKERARRQTIDALNKQGGMKINY